MKKIFIALVVIFLGIFLSLTSLSLQSVHASAVIDPVDNRPVFFKFKVGEVHGVITTGPVSPVCLVNSPCYIPYQGFIAVIDSHGKIVQYFKTNKNGKYSLHIKSGNYFFEASPCSAYLKGKCFQIPVHIRSGHSTEVNFNLDTRLR